MTDAQKKPFQVGSATFGDGRLTIIAGPCVIESRDHAMMMARECSTRAQAAGLDFVFKSSFDKANRSSLKSFRGLGMDEGLTVLADIKKEFGVPVLTDVHDVTQVAAVATVADILQIPAFLSRQTDLVLEAARSGRPMLEHQGQEIVADACTFTADPNVPPRALNPFVVRGMPESAGCRPPSQQAATCVTS